MIRVRVQRITYQTPAVLAFDLVAVDDSALPPFTAGSHVDVHLPNGIVRQYSLYNSPLETRCYCIAVLNESASRGGSRAMHALRAGDLLTLSEPRNHFPLVPGAGRYVLVAGGIGITPVLCMFDELVRVGADVVLHYCTRSVEQTPFHARLAPSAVEGHRVHFHHDGGVAGRGLNVTDLFVQGCADTHVYCCGPAGLMNAVRTATAHWPTGTVHFESFASPELPSGASGAGSEFEVEIASTGAVIEVPPHMSMVQALRTHGVNVDTSCEAGTCGTCMTRYLAGEPDHQDYVLDEEQQREFVMVCVSRSKSRRLKLDL